MPRKDKEHQRLYDQGYHAGYRKATIDHLGGKCFVEGCDVTKNLQFHHPKGLKRRSRSHRDLKNLDDLELRCEKHHPDTDDWKKRRFKKSHI